MSLEAKNQPEIQWMMLQSFSAKLDTVTFSGIQEILEEAFLSRIANPTYMALSTEDHKAISEEVTRFTKPHRTLLIAQLANTTTGRLMHVVPLPDIELGKLLFGSFDNEVVSD